MVCVVLLAVRIEPMIGVATFEEVCGFMDFQPLGSLAGKTDKVYIFLHMYIIYIFG